MQYEMGLPDVEVRLLIEGSEVAVAALFISERGHVDVIVGCIEPDEASRVAMCAEIAAEAWRTADWKSVAGMDEVTAPFDVEGDEPSSFDEGRFTDMGGDVNQGTEFPF